MDPYETANAALPLLAVGQAQKEMTHNEALVRVDLLLSGRAVAAGLNTPPSAPVAGQCWIIGTSPTDDWTGRARQIAGWTDGGWRFVVPWAGLALRVGGTQQLYRFDGTAWVAPPSVPSPAGGTNVDTQARTAIDAVVAALVAQGLLSAA
jgi:hypothetical protein